MNFDELERIERSRVRRSVARSQRKNGSLDTSNLPYCPESAQVEYTNQGPCKKHRRKKQHRKSYRVPLRKEDGNLESQVIEYNCEFPNRVVVRLEYLMQTTKVRLNDRQFMDEFYEGLLEDERKALRKETRAREKAEQNRMKQLIVEGIDKNIPNELFYLHGHPVFRVHKMLQRLNRFDYLLTNGDNLNLENEITAVEPYEYDGNRFFKHLHDTGTLWMPEEHIHHDKEKLIGKIYRAKLRLLHKREQRRLEEKIIHILNAPPSKHTLKTGNDADDEKDVSSTSTEEDAEKAIIDPKYACEHKRGLLAIKMQTKSRMKMSKIQEKIKESKERELAREAVLDIKRRELEHVFVETVKDNTINLMADYEKKQRRRTVEEILERDRVETMESIHQHHQNEITKGRMRPYEKVFEKESMTLQGKAQKYEGTLFDQLRRAYDIPGTYPVHKYEHYDNKLVSGYLDKAQGFEDEKKYGDEVTLMYDRQNLVLEEHMNDDRRDEEEN